MAPKEVLGRCGGRRRQPSREAHPATRCSATQTRRLAMHTLAHQAARIAGELEASIRPNSMSRSWRSNASRRLDGNVGETHNTCGRRCCPGSRCGGETAAGRGNDTRIVQYLKPVPDTAETAPVTDTVSEATDEDMFVSGGGEAADRATSSDSEEEEEEVSRRPQRNRRAPNRPDV